MNDRLTFVNVTLSGRRHFTQDCATEDWCTHCLDTYMLVANDDGSYQTVIDHHEVNPSGLAYEEWQAKCGASKLNVFKVSPGSVLSFEGCDLLDIRFRPISFVNLLQSTLVLTHTTIQRMDADMGFIYTETNTNNTLVIVSCYVTDLNRDHALSDFNPNGGLFINIYLSQLIISNSVFEDNISYAEDLFFGVLYMSITITDNFEMTDSYFLRGIGSILIWLGEEAVSGHINNVTFQSVFSYSSVLKIYSPYGVLISLTNCSFIDNQSNYPIFFGYGGFVQNRMLYRNNRIMQSLGQSVCYLVGNHQLITDCMFENNGPYDSTVAVFWADYYLDNGLINDDGLTTEKNELTQTSSCISTLFISLSTCPTIVNVIITEDIMPACASSMSFDQLSPDDNGSIAVIESLLISSYAAIALSGIFVDQTGTFYLANSVLEYGGRLLVLEGTRASVSLLASNVTFQLTKGTISITAPVSLSEISGIFRQCQWKHNIGRESGALAVYLGSLDLQSSVF